MKCNTSVLSAYVCDHLIPSNGLFIQIQSNWNRLDHVQAIWLHLRKWWDDSFRLIIIPSQHTHIHRHTHFLSNIYRHWCECAFKCVCVCVCIYFSNTRRSYSSKTYWPVMKLGKEHLINDIPILIGLFFTVLKIEYSYMCIKKYSATISSSFINTSTLVCCYVCVRVPGSKLRMRAHLYAYSHVRLWTSISRRVESTTTHRTPCSPSSHALYSSWAIFIFIAR